MIKYTDEELKRIADSIAVPVAMEVFKILAPYIALVAVTVAIVSMIVMLTSL